MLEVSPPSEGEGNTASASRWDYKRVGGGLLVQTPDQFNVRAAGP